MKRWQWSLQELAAKLGLPGLAGIALLIAAAVVLLGAVQPGMRDIASLKADLASSRSQPQLGRKYAPAEELALFYDFFPKRDILTTQLRTVHQLAADEEVAIERVDYKLSRIAGTPLWRYQIIFPLITDYATLRRYVASVLKALPNAALEDIELQRTDADAEVLDAKISLALYFRESP
jgi:hypothetical protein